MKKSTILTYDSEVISQGEHVASLTFNRNFNPSLLENSVLRASVLSGQRVDWHHQGHNGAAIKALGNLDLAKRFLELELVKYKVKYSIAKDKNLLFPFSYAE